MHTTHTHACIYQASIAQQQHIASECVRSHGKALPMSKHFTKCAMMKKEVFFSGIEKNEPLEEKGHKVKLNVQEK